MNKYKTVITILNPLAGFDYFRVCVHLIDGNYFYGHETSPAKSQNSLLIGQQTFVPVLCDNFVEFILKCSNLLS